LDGNIHEDEQVRLKDEDRTLFLMENRINVIRFRNEEVEQDTDGVLRRIREYINNSINK